VSTPGPRHPRAHAEPRCGRATVPSPQPWGLGRAGPGSCGAFAARARVGSRGASPRLGSPQALSTGRPCAPRPWQTLSSQHCSAGLCSSGLAVPGSVLPLLVAGAERRPSGASKGGCQQRVSRSWCLCAAGWIRESQNHEGRKRPPRSSSPTITPTPACPEVPHPHGF